MSATPSSQNRRRGTPKQYVDTITAHARRGMQDSLIPGVNYQHLAAHLNSYSSQARNHHTASGHVGGYDFVTIHNLKYSRDNTARISSFQDTGDDQIQKFEAYELPESGSGHLIFIKGYPSPKWMAAIGARYRVDPEYFRRFLNFGHSRNYFDLPSLPSSSENIINIPITSIGNHSGLFTARDKQEEFVATHLSRLESQGPVGASIVRHFSIHDDEYFSLEQNLLITIARIDGGGWNAIISLDIGREFTNNSEEPWTKISPISYKDVFLPTVRSEPNIALKKCPEWAKIPAQSARPGMRPLSYLQSVSLLSHGSYGRLLNETLMSTDWFYALHEIFSFYACSENQFVNLLKYRLYTVQKSEYEAKSDSMQSTLRDLIYHKKLLDRHLEGMQQMSALVKHHADTAQMHAASAPHTLSLENNLQPDATTLRPAALRLSADFDHLLRVANALAYQYKECMEDLRNKAQLHESQQAIEQAKGMAHLTLLAFLFVPLSFTTSFFGMNFTEIGEQRNLSIWIWVTFSIPIMILSLLVCFWSKISSKIRHLRRTK